jgi:hypothetical protein
MRQRALLRITFDLLSALLRGRIAADIWLEDMSNAELWLYALPALPAIVRVFVATRFSGYMRVLLPEEALQRMDHRTVFAALASISFAGLLALVVLPGLPGRQLSIWFMLVSFLCLLAALNLQGYKVRRWHDWAGDALFEGAVLALLGAIATFVVKSDLSVVFRAAVVVFAATVWLADFCLRIYFEIDNLRALEERDGLTTR